MYKEVLQNPTIRRLSIVQFVAYFGAWFSNVAIYTLILEFGVTPIINALVVAMYSLPAILLAPMSGAIVDKLPYKRFMIILLGIELLMTLMYLLVSDISDVWLLMLFIFIRMSAASLFFTAEMSLLPQVVSGEALKRTNELHSIIWSVTFALGMAVGGVATNMLGTSNVFLIDALLFLIAILLFSRIEVRVVKKKSEALGQMIKDGYHYIRSNHMVIHLMLLHSAVALTTMDALVNLLTDYHYKYIIAIPLAIGWINATRAIALMVGPFVIGKIVNTKNLHKVLLVQGLMFILWAFIEHDFYLSLIGMFFVGFFTTTLWSFTYTLIQENSDQKYLGRVVAYNDMIFMIVAVLVTMFIGVASKLGMPLSLITIMIGVGFILTSFYYRWFIKAYPEILKPKGDQ
ncbi:MAG: MFS transporter [Epsilonproteobacteria bacterium]|nr:MFS transporter [Campylobacterota bacterium]